MTLPKNIILLVAFLIVLLTGILIGVGIYYYYSPVSLPCISNQNQETAQKQSKTLKPNRMIGEPENEEDLEKLMNERYPDILEGIFNFSNLDGKATLKTDDGKEYWLLPIGVEKYLNELGYKNGQKIKLRGKIFIDEKTKENVFGVKMPN